MHLFLVIGAIAVSNHPGNIANARLLVSIPNLGASTEATDDSPVPCTPSILNQVRFVSVVFNLLYVLRTVVLCASQGMIMNVSQRADSMDQDAESPLFTYNDPVINQRFDGRRGGPEAPIQSPLLVTSFSNSQFEASEFDPEGSNSRSGTTSTREEAVDPSYWLNSVSSASIILP